MNVADYVDLEQQKIKASQNDATVLSILSPLRNIDRRVFCAHAAIKNS